MAGLIPYISGNRRFNNDRLQSGESKTGQRSSGRISKIEKRKCRKGTGADAAVSLYYGADMPHNDTRDGENPF